VVRRSIYLLRARKLYELCKQAELTINFKGQQLYKNNVSKETTIALEYLRNQVAPLVDHENKKEVNRFKQLCTHLCLSEDTSKVNLNAATAKSIESKYSFRNDILIGCLQNIMV
jgi:hypothetical protein